MNSSIPFSDALRVWSKIGLLSFGGPAAQIAMMHRVLVDEKKWLGEKTFLNALSFCMLLPGPEAMQLATYAGWRLHGVRGGLVAGLLFVLPGACVMLALSAIYVAFGKVALVEAIFFGVKAAVLVIVIEALLRVARRALSGVAHWMIAGLSFVAIFFAGAPFPLLIAAAALYGYFFHAQAHAPVYIPEPVPDAGLGQRPARRTLATIVIWLAIWFAPLAVLIAVFDRSHISVQLFWFFSKLAVVTFGGAYAVLAYMAQDVVQIFGWLSAGAMLDGLGLAETTPGPLILVTEFVGFLAAWNQGGFWLGLLGAGVALWATFAPCFLWILAGAPYIEWITAQPRLRGALAAISAAVVGVMLNLAIWFALHVFFARVDQVRLGPLNIWTPDLSTLDWRIVALALISGYLLLVRHWNIAAVIAIAAVLGLAVRYSGLPVLSLP